MIWITLVLAAAAALGGLRSLVGSGALIHRELTQKGVRRYQLHGSHAQRRELVSGCFSLQPTLNSVVGRSVC